MEALYQTAGQVREEVALAHKLLLRGIVMFVIFLAAGGTAAKYTVAQRVEGTVVAKGATTNMPEFDPAGMLTVQRPDGTRVEVETSRSRYSQAAVGHKWMVSGKDGMPLLSKLLLVVMGLSALIGGIAFVRLLRMF